MMDTYIDVVLQTGRSVNELAHLTLLSVNGFDGVNALRRSK
jgi:hypothetical protein